MTVDEKSVKTEPSGLTPGQIRSRRNFLKWGVIGGLAACPIAVTLYRKFHDGAYRYVYQGPFEEGEPSPEIKAFGGTQWLKRYDVTLWTGNAIGYSRIPAPDSLYVSFNGASYEICASFSYPAEIAETSRFEFKFDAQNNGSVIASKLGRWGDGWHQGGENATTNIYDDLVQNRFTVIKSAVSIVQARISFDENDDILLGSIDRLILTLRKSPLT